MPAGARQGVNDFGKVAWGGPCPPPGHGAHRYRFTLHALNLVMDLADGATRSDRDKAMEGHVLDEAVLAASYERA